MFSTRSKSVLLTTQMRKTDWTRIEPLTSDFCSVSLFLRFQLKKVNKYENVLPNELDSHTSLALTPSERYNYYEDTWGSIKKKRLAGKSRLLALNPFGYILFYAIKANSQLQFFKLKNCKEFSSTLPFLDTFMKLKIIEGITEGEFLIKKRWRKVLPE